MKVLKYCVITQDGFGGETILHIADSKKAANKRFDELYDQGRLGTQNYPMPDGEEYWDNVGYDYSIVATREFRE